MTQVIRRSLSYTQGVGRSTSFKLTLPGMYGSIPRCITVCESCGQSHDQRSKNHLYDYPVEVDDYLQCQICLQPLVDPVDTPCGHTFCYFCMLNHLRRTPSCPCDRQPLCEKDIRSSCLIVRNTLDKLTVVCPNTAYCDETMPRSSLERHLRLSCPGTYVQCPREEEGCNHVGARIQLEEHLWTCSYGQDKDLRSGRVIPIEEGHICVVEIPKGSNDLGLLVSQCERTGALIIEDVLVEGNAYRDGRLAPGDQILEINNQNFSNKSLAQARLALASLSPLMRLVILRNPCHEVATADTELIEIVKDHHRPLGLHIRSKKHRAGIFVHHVVAGSPADECGCFSVGDRILEVNGYNIKHTTIDHAAAVMGKSEQLIRLLVEHRQRLSSDSAHSSSASSSSCRSNPSVVSSERSNRSPVDHASSRSPVRHAHSRSPIDHAHSRTSYEQPHKHYEEVFTPRGSSGFPVGSRKCIIVRKDLSSSMGLSISGGVPVEGTELDLPVFVSAIKPGSAVDINGNIQRGDILLSINGTTLLGKTHCEAVEIMQSLVTTTVVRMELVQGEEVFEEEEGGGVSPDWREWVEKYSATSQSDSPLEYVITLSREGTQSLGFSIVGGINSSKGDSPIYIKGIAPKSIAAQDGRLQCRDQVTSINNISTGNKTQAEVVDIIKSSVGNVTLCIIPHGICC